MTSPRISVLLDDRTGHQSQVLGFAELLEWGYETRSLAFKGSNQIHNGIPGARALSLGKSASDDLSPSYPDLLIAKWCRCLPVARWNPTVTSN